MPHPILIAYETKHVSTHEVAEYVAARMRERGHEVDVRPAAEVGKLDAYGAVVVVARSMRAAGIATPGASSRSTVPSSPAFPSPCSQMGPLKLEPSEVESARRQLDRAWADELAGRFADRDAA